MKLKHFYEEVEDGKPVDIKHLRQEIDEVIHEMEEDVELKKSQREILESKDEAVHKKHDADLLKGLEKDLPMTGLTTEKQDYAIMYEVTEIMRDLANNHNLDTARVNKYMLKKMGLSAKTIDEIMKLKHIYDEVKSGKPIDFNH